MYNWRHQPIGKSKRASQNDSGRYHCLQSTLKLISKHNQAEEPKGRSHYGHVRVPKSIHLINSCNTFSTVPFNPLELKITRII